jgi:hypothetical protein
MGLCHSSIVHLATERLANTTLGPVENPWSLFAVRSAIVDDPPALPQAPRKSAAHPLTHRQASDRPFYEARWRRFLITLPWPGGAPMAPAALPAPGGTSQKGCARLGLKLAQIGCLPDKFPLRLLVVGNPASASNLDRNPRTATTSSPSLTSTLKVEPRGIMAHTPQRLP